MAYPASAGRWISEARFSGLPYNGKLIVSAFAGVLDFYLAAEKKFGDQWQWSRGEVPLRQRGQAGTLKAIKMRRDADFLGSLNAFENAMQKGMVGDYLMRHLDEAANPGGRELLIMAYQLDNVLAAACDLLCESLARPQLPPKTIAHVLDLICDPEDKKGARLSRHVIEGYYVDHAHLAMVQVFVRIFSDMLDLVLSKVHPVEDAFSREDMLKTFYFLGAVLLGYRASDLQEIVWRAEEKEKTDRKVDKELAEWRLANAKELKKLDGDALQSALNKKRSELHDAQRTNINGKLATLISDRSGKLLRTLLAGDSRSGPAISSSFRSPQGDVQSPYKGKQE